MIRDFWRNYQRSSRQTVVLMELAITIVIGTSLLVAGISPDSQVFFIVLLVALITTTFLNSILVNFLLTPLRDISMVMTNAAGQEPTGKLTNPNIRRYATNGFREMLLYAYNLNAADTPRAQPTHIEAVTTAKQAVPDELTTLTTALNTTKSGVVILDTTGHIIYANKSAPVTVNRAGERILELLFEQPDAFDRWLTNCRETAVHSEQIWERVPNRIVGDENRRIFNITANYEKGSAAEVVLVFYDATNTYQPEDDDLDFISFAAHELRGPITVIRGYLDVLSNELGDQIAPDQRELFDRLTVSANRLSGYVNNILNTSRFDRRHLNIHLSEEHLSDIYETINDDMQLRASSHHRLLSVDISQTLPTIAADRSSLSEVISNLIDNALKYSNEGGAVAVTAEQEGNSIKVSIVDNGIGIPQSVIGNLFHKFYRSHRSRETVAGTGIGLYICKAIVESHGGKIGVSSIEGQGSTFWFTIPTYASIADKLQANDYSNAGLITSHDGWIKNHSKYTG